MKILLTFDKETKNCAAFSNAQYMKGSVYFLKSLFGESVPTSLEIEILRTVAPQPAVESL